MSEPVPASTVPAKRVSWFERNYFLLRRLHSLTGIVPIGVFLIAHLTTNSSVAWGKFALRGEHPDLGIADGGVAYFQKEVAWLNNEIPHLLLIELVLWGSIAFHAGLGVVYALSGKSNTTRYAYQDNWRYTLQRWTGYLGIFFIAYHVATLRWGWSFLVPGGTEWSHAFASSTLARALQGGTEGMSAAGIAISAFYFLGVTALIFHFANGLWTAAITWGLTVSAPAQRRWGFVCAALGAGLMAAGWASVIGFATLDARRAEAIERTLERPAAPSPTAAAAER
jgi:succinate dehydrogenase / fumarate reductase cytochrome b subunit